MNDLEENDLLFLVEFTDGYSVRNFANFLRHTKIESNFIFTKDSIKYHEADSDDVLFVSAKIDVCKLGRYCFYADDDDIILVGILLADLQARTKNIGKKDGCRMYLKRNDPNLYLQILSVGKSQRSNLNFIRTKTVGLQEYTLPTYQRADNQPNCNTSLNEFAKTCKNLGSVKCDYISVVGYPRGMAICAYVEGKIVGVAEEFGECEKPSGQLSDCRDIFDGLDIDSPVTKATTAPATKCRPKLLIRQAGDTVLIPSDRIKALGHLNNISLNGIVTFFVEKDKPWKIIVPFGYMGTVEIYIRDIKGYINPK